MLLTTVLKKPENLATKLETDSGTEILWGRSRTDIICSISESRSEINLNTMSLQSKKKQTTTKELVLSADGDVDDLDYCLLFYDGHMFATIIEDTIIKLRILDGCGTELQTTKTLADFDALRRLRFNVADSSLPTDEIFDIDPNKVDTIGKKTHKIHKDRTGICDLFNKLYIELSTKRCFDELKDRVNDIRDQKDSFKILQETQAKNKIIRKELQKQLRSQRNRMKAIKYDSDVSIDKLLKQIEDTNLLTEIRGRYVDNWENARSEQHVLTTKKKEAKLIKSSNYYKVNANNEHRVHAEIETLTNRIISDTLIQTEEWMEKYDTDMEAIDIKIHIQRNEYANVIEKRIDLEQTFALHDKQIWDWKGFKEERERLQWYHDTMQKSAIILQAWWRGIIVRKQLGPFKPKKKVRSKKK